MVVVLVHDGELLVMYEGMVVKVTALIMEMKCGRSNCNRSNAAVEVMTMGMLMQRCI